MVVGLIIAPRSAPAAEAPARTWLFGISGAFRMPRVVKIVAVFAIDAKRGGNTVLPKPELTKIDAFN
jgi:hypothetical protein